MTAPYKRILVKLSGEALLGTTEFGIDPLVLKRYPAWKPQTEGFVHRVDVPRLR